jgi:glutaredoxin
MIKLYTKEDCPLCKTHGERVKQFLEDYNYKHTIINCDTYDGLADATLNDIFSLPCLFITDKDIKYFSELPSNDNLKEVLNGDK